VQAKGPDYAAQSIVVEKDGVKPLMKVIARRIKQKRPPGHVAGVSFRSGVRTSSYLTASRYESSRLPTCAEAAS
jgi:hypothetical protein